MDYDDFLKYPPYGLSQQEKQFILTQKLVELTCHHIENCKPYGRMMRALGFDETRSLSSYEELPFLPVSLFKELELQSICAEDVFKTMTSSGTTGQAVSRIVLDRQTAANQQKTLRRIVHEFLPDRRPMLIIDSPSVIKDRTQFSARGAGILGFSIFGARPVYALRDDMTLDFEALETFFEKYGDSNIFVFGFTFMIWQHFVQALRQQGRSYKFKGTLFHGGGWKKLVEEAVSPQSFKQEVKEVSGIESVHDYYGMVEQTGCIYVECENGRLHASTYSDIIIRDTLDWSVCKIGKKGVIQVVSSLPESYPGHSLLTEDEGVLLGEDDCPCGRKGKTFRVLGRLKNAEIRGCSDTYAQTFR